jgi:CheY-like chemotaxis protein
MAPMDESEYSPRRVAELLVGWADLVAEPRRRNIEAKADIERAMASLEQADPGAHLVAKMAMAGMDGREMASTLRMSRDGTDKALLQAAEKLARILGWRG